MRFVIITMISLIAAPVMAANLAGKVFAYECEQINPAKAGFSCKIETDGATTMYIHYVKNSKELPEKQRKYMAYRFNALLLRYFNLGGKHYVITADHWDKGHKRKCSKIKNRRYVVTCQ